jgi:hypothetical protein
MATDELIWKFYPTIRIGAAGHVISVSPVHVCETSELLRVTFQDCPDTEKVWIGKDIEINIRYPIFVAFWKLINRISVPDLADNSFLDIQDIGQIKLMARLINYFNITDKNIVDAIYGKIINFPEVDPKIEEFEFAAVEYAVPKLESYLSSNKKAVSNYEDLDVYEYVDNLSILFKCTGEKLVQKYIVLLLKPNINDMAVHNISTFRGLLEYFKEVMNNRGLGCFNSLFDELSAYFVYHGFNSRFPDNIGEFGQQYI